MTCSRNFDRLLHVTCLGLVGMLAVAGCGGSSNNPGVDAARGDGNNLPPGEAGVPQGALTIDKVSVTFGSVDVGESSATPQIVTVANSGAAAASIVPTVTGPFSISQTCVSVPAKGTCQISVVFTPTAVGPVSGVLVVNGTLAVSLSGTGVPAGNFSVAGVDLGQLATNASATGAVTVTATAAVSDLACTLSGAELTADPTKVCPAALAAGASCTVGFTFKATTAGPKSDSVVCNAAGLTKTAVVAAMVLDPAKLVIAPTTGTFQTPNGTQSAAVTFGVANSGGLPTGQISATLTGTNASQFAITVPGCLAPLAGAGNCTIQVVCNPTSVGTKTATLTVADATAAAASVTAALTCVSVGPTTLTVTGTANLGSVVIGNTGAPQTFTVTNTGTTASGTLTVSVGDPAQFVTSADTCTGTSLAAAGTCTVAVALRPTAVAPGTILSVTAASGNPGSIQLSGIGLPPGKLTVAPPSNDFGSIPINTVSADVNFTVTNGGGAATGALTVSAPGSGFVVAGNSCAAALQPTQTCTVAIHFAPTIVGNAAGTLTVSDGTLSGSSALHGTGTPAAALVITPSTTCAGPEDVPETHHLPPICSDSATTFAATVIGQTNGSYGSPTPPPAGIIFTVSNGNATTPSTTETGALTFTTSGDAKADFVITNNNCPATLPPGSSCTVVVNFTPTAAGARAALLQVSTVKGGNAAANLNGLGLPFIEILPCSLKDGSIAGGSLFGTCTPLDSTLGTNFEQVSSGVFDPVAFPNQQKTFVVRVRGSSAANHLNTLALALSTPTTPADFRVANVADSNCNNFVANVTSGIAQCTVLLDFFPQSTAGDKTGTLTLTGSGGGTASVNVTGTATGPLTFSPSPVDFGSVAVGSVATTTTSLSVVQTMVTVTNHGGVAQGPLSFTITGANAAEFATVDDNCSGVTLAASGGNCTLSFLMLPVAPAGAKAATLTVTAGTQSSTVQFVGVATSQTTVAVAPTSNDFANVAANAQSAYTAVTVSMVGTAETGNILYELEDCVGTATACGGFEIAQAVGELGTCGTSDTQHLGGTNPTSCTIKVRFHPTQMLGLQSATLAITEARSGQLVNVPLTGTSTSQLTLSASSHDFGLVAAQGASAVYTFTVTNAGLTTVTPLVNFINTDVPTTVLDTRLNTNGTSTTCGTAPLGAGSTCFVAVSVNPAPNTPGNAFTSTLVVNAPTAPTNTSGGVVVPVGAADAEASLTASIVSQAQLQVVGFTTTTGFANTVNFGTVPQGGTSNNVTIWYTNLGDVATTPIHYLWTDSSGPTGAGPLLTDAPDPYFPFVGDVGSTPCVGNSGLAPGALCSVSFHLAAGQGAGSLYRAVLELNATNAGASQAITAMGEGAASTGAPHIVPSFVNFSPTAATAIGASTAAQAFQLFGPVSGSLSSSNPDFVVDPTNNGGASPCGASVSLATASASCNFTVTFTPGGTAPPAGDQFRLGMVAIGGPGGAVAGFIGKVQEPTNLVFQTASGGNDFGNVVRNVRSAAKTMTITNMGDVASPALTLVTGAVLPATHTAVTSTQAVGDAGRFAPGTECNKVINPGETCSFTLTVLANATVPLPQGAYDIEVEAQSTSGTTTTTQAWSDPISANGVDAAVLSLTPSNTVTFTDQPVGTVGAVTNFTIQNGNPPTATQNSGVLTIALTPKANYDVDMTGCASETSAAIGKGLVSSSSCVVTIAFHPAVGVTLGNLPAALTVTSPAGGSVSVNVTGKAIAAMAFVANNTPPSGGSLFTTLATTPTAFGTLAVGTLPAFVVTPHQVIQFWVENALNAPDTGLLSTTLTGSDFRLIWNNCIGERLGYTSSGSEFCDMGVRFEPSSAGAKTGSLSVSGLPGPGNTATMALTGTGS